MNDQVNRTVVNNESKKKKKCYSTTFLENESIFMWILEGVLILAFVRLCICQLISASGVVALTGSGSIKVVFGASICLCEMKQKRMAVTVRRRWQPREP